MRPFILQIFWDITDLSSFRMYIILLAILSFVGFQYTALYLQPPSTQFEPTGEKHSHGSCGACVE